MSLDSGLLTITGVTKVFDSPSQSASPGVLRGVNLTLAAGESVAIIGPSGSGKSTLLNLIGTLDRPSSGQIVLHGKDLAALQENDLAEVRNRQIGFIFQLHHLLPQCTVLENVLLPTVATRDVALRQGAPARALDLLKRVGLSEHVHARPSTLSGGERQRVAVVRALINRPALLLADEPTGALDRQSAETLTQLLLDLNREQNLGLIVVTHSLDLARQMKRVFELRDGLLVDITA
ncbi:MAG: ABC transporter ATP-binding protein [Verrucomicrobia bacterium]|jgi:ABC-type lipoprotein export system ATPase subunit|nr:MAG: ABC transporter ATP-binding protein [Verrucomicrobiota bacterium]